MKQTSDKRKSRGWKRALWLFAFFFALLLTPGFNSFETPDAPSVYNFWESGTLGLSEAPGDLYVRGADELYYSVHEAGTLVASLPFGGFAFGVAAFTRHSFSDTFQLLMSFVAAGLFACTFLVLVMAGQRLGVPAAFFAPRLFLLLVGSQYLIYGLTPSDVSFSAPLLAGTFYLWLRTFRKKMISSFWIGLMLGLACLFKITNLVLVPVVGLLILTSGRETLPQRLTGLAWFLLGLIPGAAGTMIWNEIRTGSPWAMPYQFMHDFDINWLPEGLFGTLLSTGKGLLVYTPALLLLIFGFARGGFFQRFPRVGFFIWGGFILCLIRIAGTHDWTGGGGWGIRYYAAWLPVLLAAAAAEWYTRQRSPVWKFAAPSAVGLGMLINLSGTLTNYHFRQMLFGYEAWGGGNPMLGAVGALPGNLARTLGFSVAELSLQGASERTVFISNRLAVWWYGIQTAGVNAWICWGTGLLLLSLTLFFAWQFHRICKLYDNTRQSEPSHEN